MTDNSHRATKYHEGWTLHKPAASESKIWTKYWLILRGQKLFLFSSEKTVEENLIGMLRLNHNTQLRTLTSAKSFKFELTTESLAGDKKINRFKFDSVNERDLWKTFIIGLASGTIPTDTQLLPGQLHCINEAIQELSRSEPPLVPTTTRPSLTNQRHSVDSGHTRPSLVNQRLSVDSGHASLETIRREDQNMETTEDIENPTMVNNLRTLIKRQTDPLIKQLSVSSESTLGTKAHSSPLFVQRRQGPVSQTSVTEFRGVNAATMIRRQTMPEISTENVPSMHAQRNSIASSNISDFSLPDTTSINSFNSISESHLFYQDSKQNGIIPPWFFDTCSRQEAEQILTMGCKYGNILIRTSSHFSSSGKYVLSFRQEDGGVTKLHHYSVVRTGSDFKLEVKNEHEPLKSLSAIMKFFVSVAGPGARPLTTNELSIIYGQVKGLPIDSSGTYNRQTSRQSLSDSSAIQSPAVETVISTPSKHSLHTSPLNVTSKSTYAAPLNGFRSSMNSSNEPPSSSNVSILREKRNTSKSSTESDNVSYNFHYSSSSGAMQRANSADSDDYKSTIGENMSAISQSTTKNCQSPASGSSTIVRGTRAPMLRNQSLDSCLAEETNSASSPQTARISNGQRLSIHGNVSDALLSAVGDINRTTQRNAKKMAPPTPLKKHTDLNFEQTKTTSINDHHYTKQNISKSILPSPKIKNPAIIPTEEIYSNASEVSSTVGTSTCHTASNDSDPTDSVAVLRQKLMNSIGSVSTRTAPASTMQDSTARRISYSGVGFQAGNIQDELQSRLIRRREDIYTQPEVVYKTNVN